MAAEEDKLAGWMDESGGTAPAGDPPPADPASEAGLGEFVPVDPPPAEGGADAAPGDFVPVDPPPAEPAPEPEVRKPASGVRRGGTGKIGARPRPAAGTRPALARPPKSKLTKYLALSILILIPALIGVGIWRGVWTKLLQEAGLVAKPVVSKPPPPKVETELDQQFRQAEAYFATVDAFVAGELKAFEDKHATEKPAYEELKAFVEKLDRMRGEITRAMEPLAKVNDEAAKPEAIRRLTIEPAPIQERHKTAQQALDKIIASAGAWEKILREIRPKHTPSSSQVSLRPLEPALLGFWAAAAPGQWFRQRTTRTADGRTTVAHEDTIVDGVEHAVVKGRRIDERGARTFETPQAPSDPALGAEEKIDVGGTSYAVQVVDLTEEGTRRKDWICRDPIALNLLALRREQEGTTWVAASMGADTLMIGDRSISCVLVEYDETPAGGTPLRSKVWYSWSVPGRVAKREAPGLTEEIVAFGPDSGEIPPFPMPETPSPEPTPSPSPSPLASPEPTPSPTPSQPPPPDPKEIAREKIEGANGKVAEANPLYKEVAAAINDAPEDAAALKALVEKGETALKLLAEAETIYRENRDLAPDPGVVDKRISGIGKLQERLKGYVETLRSKLK